MYNDQALKSKIDLVRMRARKNWGRKADDGTSAYHEMRQKLLDRLYKEYMKESGVDAADTPEAPSTSFEVI